MNRKSVASSAFLNFRVLIGLSVFLGGIFLGLLGLGAFADVFAPAKTPAARAGFSLGRGVFSGQADEQGVLSPADKEGWFVYLIDLPSRECCVGKSTNRENISGQIRPKPLLTASKSSLNKRRMSNR